MLELKNVKASNFISHAVDVDQMSVTFETIYRDNRVQSYLKGLKIQDDFAKCQALMSNGLAQLKSAKANFQQQKAYLQD